MDGWNQQRALSELGMKNKDEVVMMVKELRGGR